MNKGEIIILNKIAVLGIKMDLGKANRGADQGPQTLRESDLLNSISSFCEEVKDLGDLTIEISDKLNSDENLEFHIHDIINDFEKISEHLSSAVTENYFLKRIKANHFS